MQLQEVSMCAASAVHGMHNAANLLYSESAECMTGCCFDEMHFHIKLLPRGPLLARHAKNKLLTLRKGGKLTWYSGEHSLDTGSSELPGKLVEIQVSGRGLGSGMMRLSSAASTLPQFHSQCPEPQ